MTTPDMMPMDLAGSYAMQGFLLGVGVGAAMMGLLWLLVWFERRGKKKSGPAGIGTGQFIRL